MLPQGQLCWAAHFEEGQAEKDVVHQKMDAAQFGQAKAPKIEDLIGADFEPGFEGINGGNVGGGTDRNQILLFLEEIDASIGLPFPFCPTKMLPNNTRSIPWFIRQSPSKSNFLPPKPPFDMQSPHPSLCPFRHFV